MTLHFIPYFIEYIYIYRNYSINARYLYYLHFYDYYYPNEWAKMGKQQIFNLKKKFKLGKLDGACASLLPFKLARSQQNNRK